MRHLKISKMLLIGLLVTPVLAWSAEVDHSKMDHAAMGHGTAPVQDGPWSYKGRNNPAPYKSGRWEMVPVPEYGHMFISTQGLSKELACAALDNPGVMVDRATRARCGIAERPKAATKASPAESGAPAVDHSKMKH
jgi:hypothetical protein